MTPRRFLPYSVGASLVLLGLLAGYFLPIALRAPVGVPEAWAQDLKPLDKPPAGQTYVGEKVCSSCHFDQNLSWRQTKHAKAFEILPEKYRADKSCLKCHTTGHGEETGFKDLESTPGLVGASCESCHGPGSKHAEIAKKFAGKDLSEAEKKYIASSTYKMQPRNVCVDCHLTRAHKKHPEYTKE